jgi:hypothetical protein
MDPEPYTPSAAPEPYVASSGEMGVDADSEELTSNEEDQEEEELYTRGRSRSRSVHANDDAPDSNIVTPIDPSSYISKGNNSDQRNDKLSSERTGPLQQREVVALKKVRS